MEFVQNLDVFYVDKQIDYARLSHYQWFIDEEADIIYINNNIKAVYFSYNVVTTNPILASAIKQLAENASQMQQHTITKDAKELKKLHTIYNFLEESNMVTDDVFSDLTRRLNLNAVYIIKDSIRREILRQNTQKLSSMVLNKRSRDGAYWENKMDVMSGIASDGNWKITDFAYEEDWDSCELGHQIKEVIYVTDQLTGQVTKWGTTCINDFLDLNASQKDVIKSMFYKYRNMILDYWLTLAVYQQAEALFYNLQYKQMQLINDLVYYRLIDFSSIYDTGKAGLAARPNRRLDTQDGTRFTTNILHEMQIFVDNQLFIPKYLVKYVIDKETLNKIDTYVNIITNQVKNTADANNSYIPLLSPPTNAKLKPLTPVTKQTLKPLNILLKTFLLGVYGFTITDANKLLDKTNKLQQTDFIGNVLLKGQTRDLLSSLGYTLSDIKSNRCINEDIINIVEYDIKDIVNAYLYTNEINIKRIEYAPDALLTQTVDKLQVQYKGYATELTNLISKKIESTKALYSKQSGKNQSEISIVELTQVLLTLPDYKVSIVDLNEADANLTIKVLSTLQPDANITDLVINKFNLIKYLAEGNSLLSLIKKDVNYSSLIVKQQYIIGTAKYWFNLSRLNQSQIKVSDLTLATPQYGPLVQRPISNNLIDVSDLVEEYLLDKYNIDSKILNGLKPQRKTNTQTQTTNVKQSKVNAENNQGYTKVNASVNRALTITDAEALHLILTNVQGIIKTAITDSKQSINADTLITELDNYFKSEANSVPLSINSLPPHVIYQLFVLNSVIGLANNEQLKIYALKVYLYLSKTDAASVYYNNQTKLNFILTKVLTKAVATERISDKQWQYGGSDLIKANGEALNYIYKSIKHN